MIFVERVLYEIKIFFRSSIFYILLGCAFLLCGYLMSADTRTHSAFVFIVVILGVTLILYGTGTSASAAGSHGNIKVAIAGGAGVLALVLGFGVVDQQDKLSDVFKRQRDYAVVRLRLPQTYEVPLDLSSFEVRARLSGHMPLPLSKESQWIEVLVPMPEDVTRKTRLVVTFAHRDDFLLTEINPSQDFEIAWTEGGTEIIGFANELIRLYEYDLNTTKKMSLNIPPSSPGQQSIEVTPQ